MTVYYIAPCVVLCEDGNFLWQKAALILTFLDDKASVLMLFLCCQIPNWAKTEMGHIRHEGFSVQ